MLLVIANERICLIVKLNRLHSKMHLFEEVFYTQFQKSVQLVWGQINLFLIN